MTLRNAVFLAVALHAATPATAWSQDVFIQDVTIVSPELDQSLPGRDVLILDGRIAAIGGALVPPPGIAQLEGSGKYLTPGLIDSHVHVWRDGGMRPDLADENAHLIRAYRLQEPRSYLYWGFTTLLDLTMRQAGVDRWNAQDVAPQLYACRAAPYTDGYGMAFEPAEWRFNTPYYIYDPQRPDSPPADDSPSDHSPEVVVRAVAADGDARCIKTFHEPGFGGLFDFNTAPVAVLDRVARTSEEVGIFNLLHATSLASWRAGVDARVHAMAHGLWHWDELNGTEGQSESGLPPQIEALLDRVVDRDIAVQMTVGVVQGELDLYDPDFLRSDSMAHSLPAALIDWYETAEGGWFKSVMEDRIGSNPAVVELFLGRRPTGEPGEASRVAISRAYAVGRYLHARGGRLVIASDVPSSPTYTNAPGLHGHREMQAHIAMGLAPMEVLRAATLENARLLGLDEEIGSIEVGKRADLLLLGEDPTQSIDAFDSILSVILAGRVLDRAALSALVQEVDDR